MRATLQTMCFVSCDWGTSNLRLRLVGGASPGAGAVHSDDGVAKLAAPGGDRAERFRQTLRHGLEQLGAPPTLPVLISGMASSSIGWKELPYAMLPFPLDGSAAVWERLDERVYLISGLRSAVDVMRGEETQALGLAAALGRDLPDLATFILPGTHSKHIEIARGCVVDLRTYMVGELFDLLTRHSVLRHSTDPGSPFDATAFVEGVEASQRAPLPGALFRVRTRQVLNRQEPPSNTSFLSGLLIGTELAVLRGTEGSVVVAANAPMRRAYALAGETLGLGSRLKTVDAEPLSALGHSVLWQRLMGRKTDEHIVQQ